MSGVSNALAALEAGLQAMDGGFAGEFGQSFSVRRLNVNTPPQGILLDTPVIPSLYADITPHAPKTDLENEIFELLAYDATVDSTDMLIGDIVQEIGTGSAGTVYVYAQHRVARPKIFMRTAFLATITRPTPISGQVGQMPASGSVVGTYFGENQNSAWWLTLTTGEYSFGQTGPRTVVPVGIQSNVRAADGQKDDAAGSLPSKIPEPQFMVYVPDLGIPLAMKDVIHVGPITLASGIQPPVDHYSVMKLLNTGNSGLAGNICICERLPLGG